MRSVISTIAARYRSSRASALLRWRKLYARATLQSGNAKPTLSTRLLLALVAMSLALCAGALNGCSQAPKPIPIIYKPPCQWTSPPTKPQIDLVECEHALCFDSANAVKLWRYLHAADTWAQDIKTLCLEVKTDVRE